MADILSQAGKVAGMNGIEIEITRLKLLTAGDTILSTIAITASDLSVNQTTGQLSNANALIFTLGTEDVGATATKVVFYNGGSDVLMVVDLDSSLTVNYEGEATIGIGALTVTL